MNKNAWKVRGQTFSFISQEFKVTFNHFYHLNFAYMLSKVVMNKTEKTITFTSLGYSILIK